MDRHAATGARLEPPAEVPWARWGADGRLLAASPAFTDQVHVGERGASWSDVVRPEDRDRLRSEWRSRTDVEAAFPTVAQLRVAPDVYRWFRLTSWVEPDGSVAATAVDVHDLVQALNGVAASFDELTHDHAELARHAAAWEAIARALAHDLASPLSALAPAVAALAADRSDAAVRVVTEAHDALTATYEGLAGPRLASDVGPVRRSTVRIDALTEAAVADVGAQVEVVVEDAVAEVDPSLVVHLLENLVRNAVRHAGAEARIVVRAAATEGGGVRFEVEDDGAGVPDEARPQLFQAGVRGSPVEGSGEGLAIVARIAAAHGGGAWLESHDDRRTVFHAYVPGVTDRDI